MIAYAGLFLLFQAVYWLGVAAGRASCRSEHEC